MPTRLRTLTGAAVAATAILASAAHAGTSTAVDHQLVSDSIAAARAAAIATGMNIDLDVPGTDGSPCFRITVLGGSGTVLQITFWRPIANCIV